MLVPSGPSKGLSSCPSVSSRGSQDDPKKAPKCPKLAPRGITSFTVYRQHDETGVSGDGVLIEGVVMATGQCVVHWLYPPPRGGIAIFDSMSDFVKVHIVFTCFHMVFTVFNKILHLSMLNTRRILQVIRVPVFLF